MNSLPLTGVASISNICFPTNLCFGRIELSASLLGRIELSAPLRSTSRRERAFSTITLARGEISLGWIGSVGKLPNTGWQREVITSSSSLLSGQQLGPFGQGRKLATCRQSRRRTTVFGILRTELVWCLHLPRSLLSQGWKQSTISSSCPVRLKALSKGFFLHHVPGQLTPSVVFHPPFCGYLPLKRNIRPSTAIYAFHDVVEGLLKFSVLQQSALENHKLLPPAIQNFLRKYFSDGMNHQPDLNNTAHSVTSEELGSLEGLAVWLEERLPSGSSQLKLWGRSPGSKPLANLWYELLEGEISLEDSRPPKRMVNVASVLIKNDLGQTLLEAYQEMADGRIRNRNRPLSEKMRPGENVKEACLRGISEELGQMGHPDKVIIIHDSYRKEEEERESFSYPGLLTRYVIHTVEAHVKNLPQTEFFTEENETIQTAALVGASGSEGREPTVSDHTVGVKRHFWRWIKFPDQI